MTLPQCRHLWREAAPIFSGFNTFLRFAGKQKDSIQNTAFLGVAIRKVHF